jgi:hypothetical protein
LTGGERYVELFSVVLQQIFDGQAIAVEAVSGKGGLTGHTGIGYLAEGLTGVYIG